MESLKKNYFYCLVVGSRTFTDYHLMEVKLNLFLKNQDKIVIVSGGAKGADTLAERYAKENGYELKVFPADWSIGKAAGHIRNRQMHEYIASAYKRGVVAFWDGVSRGTADSFELCKEFNNPLRKVIFKALYFFSICLYF